MLGISSGAATASHFQALAPAVSRALLFFFIIIFGIGLEFFCSGFCHVTFEEYKVVVNILNVDLFLNKRKKIKNMGKEKDT